MSHTLPYISCDAKEITPRHVCIFILTSELMAADQNVIKFFTCSVLVAVAIRCVCRDDRRYHCAARKPRDIISSILCVVVVFFFLFSCLIIIIVGAATINGGLLKWQIMVRWIVAIVGTYETTMHMSALLEPWRKYREIECKKIAERIRWVSRAIIIQVPKRINFLFNSGILTDWFQSVHFI